MVSVCSVDGVPVTVARSGRLVHLADIPPGVDPDHEIVATAEGVFNFKADRQTFLKAAAEDMLAHHATLHPASDCLWATVLERALRAE